MTYLPPSQEEASDAPTSARAPRARAARYGVASAHQCVGQIVAAGWTLVILALTLLPTGRARRSFDVCITCGAMATVDVALNVLLFAPLGAALAMAGWRWRRAIAAMLALTVAIELLQLAIPGRDPSLRDILANAVGGAIGFFAQARWRAPGAVCPRPARIALLLASLAWLALHALAAWSGEVALPVSRYHGQRRAELAQFDTFPGTMIAGSANAIPIRGGADPRLGALRTRWHDEHVLIIAAAATAGPTATRRPAPIVSSFDGEQREIFVLGQRGGALVLRVRTRASDARLRPLLFALPRIFPGDDGALARSGDTVMVSGSREGALVRLRARSGVRGDEATFRVGAALAWAYWLPIEIALTPSRARLGSAAWLLLSCLLLGWCASRCAESRERSAWPLLLVIATIALGLSGIPAALDVASADITEYAAAAIGVVAGALLARAAERAGAHGERAALLEA